MEHTPLTGILADRYALEREIGRGAMATVYQARDIRHERSVAVKVLSASIAQVLGADRFLREIRIAATLQHPNVLPLYDSGEADGLLYYVMPYIAGDTLRTRLTAERRLPVAEAVTIAREAADALAHAHEAGIVHRDIKPENILLEAGHAVVADFGIARAIGAATTGGFAGARQALTAGLAIGTPGYMSPEQLAADETIDGRSDIFALGCVLYEMLTGEVPSTVHARTTDSGRRTPERLPSLRITRPDVPRWLEPVLARALAETAAERYPDARAFGEALAAGPAAAPAPVSLRRKVALSAAAVAAAAVLVWAGGKLFGPGSPPLDYDRYVVLPLLHRGAVAPRALNGDLCATMVYDALSRWPDIAKVNSLNVANLLEREGTLPKTLDQALAVTRRLGAGRLLWGEVYEIQNRTYVRMVAYDVRQPRRAVHESRIDFPSDGSEEDVTTLFFAATDTLVYGGTAGPAARGTSSFGALMAYARGDSALRQWDLDLAQQRFETALALDPAYSWANLKLAQVAQWRLQSPEVWKPFAQRAADSSSGLPAEERLRAAALVDLAEQRYPESCAKYRRLLKRDANDFQAWFGLGECQQQDELVQPDRASPSRYRFRSSYQAALNAYLKALDLVPAAHRAFEEMIWARLEGVLPTHIGQHRMGKQAGSSGSDMGAYPGLEADTLSFVPYPRERLASIAGTPLPAGFQEALARGRSRMEEVSRSWSVAFPTSATAWQARALTLERSGQLVGRPEASALGAIQRARSLAMSPGEKLDFALSEIRITLKALDAPRTRVLAESVLGSRPNPSAEEAMRLAPLAGLLGKLRLLSSLLESAAPAYGFGTTADRDLKVPPTLAGPAMRLGALAVLGTSADTIRALEGQIERGLTDWHGPDRGALRRALLEIPAIFGFPRFGARPIHRASTGNYLMELQSQVAQGDTTRAHRTLLEIEHSPYRLAGSPGDVSVDVVHQEAWLLLAVGDTAEAVSALDRSLNNLQLQWSLPFRLYHGPPGLVSAMALRAQLAAIQHDTSTARRWARAVLDLRAGSDAGTSPDTSEMHAIAGPPRGPP